MKKKYTIAVSILILLFSCGKKDKKSQNSQSKPNIENRQDDKLKELIKKAEKSRILPFAALGIGAIMVVAGVIRDEHLVVLKKAVNICLECIGIG